MSARTSSGKNTIGKERVRDLIGHAWSRICLAHRDGKIGLANHLGVCRDTIDNTISGKNLSEVHNVFNALSFDQSALDDVLREYGLQVVPIEQTSELSGAIVPMLAACHRIAEAEADGSVDHHELLAMEPDLRAASAVLARLLSRTAGVRAAA